MGVAFAGISVADPDLITVTIQKFIEISGLSNTTVYALLNRGELESVNVGRRRLIVLASYRRLLDRQLGTPAEKPVARPPLRVGTRRAARASETASPQ
jgi:excisionase family DNA binding protein